MRGECGKPRCDCAFFSTKQYVGEIAQNADDPKHGVYFLLQQCKYKTGPNKSDLIIIVCKCRILSISVNEIPESLWIFQHVLRNVHVVVDSVVVLAPSAKEIEAVSDSVCYGFGVSVLRRIPLLCMREGLHFVVNLFDGSEA